MLGNWVKEETTTTGTGNITLSAVTGYPRFSNVTGVNSLVPYCILNADGSPIEAGYGYLTDSNTLVRNIIKATYVGGTYTVLDPTAATLAAGTKTVIMADIESTRQMCYPKLFTSTSAQSRIVGIDSINLGSLSTLALTANSLNYYPYHINTSGKLVDSTLDVTTAGTNIRWGLYTMGADGGPGRLVFDSGTQAASSVAAITYTLPSAVYVTSGWYYMAVIADATVSIRSTGNLLNSDDNLGWDTTTPRYKNSIIRISSYGFGALPDPASTTSLTYLNTGASNYRPLIWLTIN